MVNTSESIVKHFDLPTPIRKTKNKKKTKTVARMKNKCRNVMDETWQHCGDWHTIIMIWLRALFVCRNDKTTTTTTIIMMIMSSTLDAKQKSEFYQSHPNGSIYFWLSNVDFINRICGKIHAQNVFTSLLKSTISNGIKINLWEKQKSNVVRNSSSQGCKMLRLAINYNSFFMRAIFVCALL